MEMISAFSYPIRAESEPIGMIFRDRTSMFRSPQQSCLGQIDEFADVIACISCIPLTPIETVCTGKVVMARGEQPT